MGHGVYSILCTANTKCYIGSSVDVYRRLYLHRWHLKRGDHDNVHLQRAWNKYGEQTFIFLQILECDLDMLRFWEKRIIDSLRPEFNLSGIDPEKNLTSLNAETKAKISTRLRGRTILPEAVAKRLVTMKGRKHSPEHKAKISAANMGRVCSRETRAKISLARMGHGFAPETLEKMATAKRGCKLTKEYRAKISQSLRARQKSQE